MDPTGSLSCFVKTVRRGQFNCSNNFLFDSCFKIYFELANMINLIEKSGYWYVL